MPQTLSTARRDYWDRHVCVAAARPAAGWLASAKECGPHIRNLAAQHVWSIGGLPAVLAYLRRFTRRASVAEIRDFLDEFVTVPPNLPSTNPDWIHKYVARAAVRCLVVHRRLLDAAALTMAWAGNDESMIFRALAEIGDTATLIDMLHAGERSRSQLRATKIMRAATACGGIGMVKALWPLVRTHNRYLLYVFDEPLGADDSEYRAMLEYLVAHGAVRDDLHAVTTVTRPAVLTWLLERNLVSSWHAAYGAFRCGDRTLMTSLLLREPNNRDMLVWIEICSQVDKVKWAVDMIVPRIDAGALAHDNGRISMGACRLACLRQLWRRCPITAPRLSEVSPPERVWLNGPDHPRDSIARWVRQSWTDPDFYSAGARV